MRVLIPHATSGNLYVQALGDAYRALGCDVIYGADNLLQYNLVPDLLHLQWPEEGYRWRNDLTLEGRVTRFLSALRHVRERGAHIVATAHNAAPHEHANNPVDLKVYQEVVNLAHVLHHHCNCSISAYRERYSLPMSLKHIVMPHPHFDLYPEGLSRDAMRARLGVPPAATVFLQFGNIRGYKGIESLLKAFGRAQIQRKHLLIVGQYQAPAGIAGIRQRLQLALRKRLSRDMTVVGSAVPSEEVRAYVEASDCLVLTHSAGLNSGVAVLGMSLGRVVIGPRLGCVESVLQAGRNLLYPTGDAAAAAEAMTRFASWSADEKTDAGALNRQVALSWRWSDLAAGVLASMGR